MGSICSGLKEEVKWEALQWSSKKMRKDQFSQELQIKENFLFVIGQLGQQTKLEVRIKQLLRIGIKREVLGLLFLWIYSQVMKILSLLFMTIIFVYGRLMCKSPSLAAWSAKDLIILVGAGVQPEREYSS